MTHPTHRLCLCGIFLHYNGRCILSISYNYCIQVLIKLIWFDFLSRALGSPYNLETRLSDRRAASWESWMRFVPRAAMSTIWRRVQKHVSAKTGTKDGQCGVVAWWRVSLNVMVSAEGGGWAGSAAEYVLCTLRLVCASRLYWPSRPCNTLAGPWTLSGVTPTLLWTALLSTTVYNSRSVHILPFLRSLTIFY